MGKDKWASIEDFATLFQYSWYRDFPMDQKSPGARRSDWTIHTGIVVRRVADLMGFHSRFESGKRKDAVLRNTEQDVVALEWEWEGVWGNEIKKLKNHKLWTFDKDDSRLLQYAVFITYTHAYNIDKVYERVLAEWESAPCPLLLILIDVEESKEFFSHKEFKKIQMSVFSQGERVKRRELRSVPAFPWRVPKTRWSREIK